MRVRSLLLLAGAPLRGLAQGQSSRVLEDRDRLPDLKTVDDSSSAAAVSKRTHTVAGAAVVDESLPHHRFLEVHFEAASEGELVVRSDFAYAALLMDEDDRGIRTLGQSLIDSRTPADLVAVLAPGVSLKTESRMRAQGWRIRRLAVDDIGGEDPFASDRADGAILAHTAAWALTEYKRVVLLEDNMLVVENIDDLFLCSGVCAVMEQAELVSTSLLVLEPDLETHREMAKAVGAIYSFSDNFQGFLNSYLTGFESCALFDLENVFIKDASTDPNRGPDAALLDHTCRRLPTRYNGDLSLIMLNGGLGMVRTKNPMPEEWWRQRRARVVRFGFGGLRPWMWFASPFLPFVSTWESAHARAKPGDSTPSVLLILLAWLSFVGAALVGWAVLFPTTLDGSDRVSSRRARWIGGGGYDRWLARCPRLLSWATVGRRGGAGSGYNPRGLLWSLVHLTVGYCSLACAVAVGVRRVPAACSVWMSWTVFIVWTSTVLGLLWSVYLLMVYWQSQKMLPRLSAVGNASSDAGAAASGGLSPPPLHPAAAAAAGVALSTQATRNVEGGAGGVSNVGAVAPPSPWRESVTSLALFAAVLFFLPAWKPLSGASSLASLLGPAVLAVVALSVGLTVQMVRLPVLWFDRCRCLSRVEREGLDA